MNLKSTSRLLVFSLFLAFSSACKKEASCFDPELKKRFESSHCTMDCPGVTGCDGRSYCNECMAARNGIRIKK
jgi:hypothetical protein